jgi:hypothetical protein
MRILLRCHDGSCRRFLMAIAVRMSRRGVWRA